MGVPHGRQGRRHLGLCCSPSHICRELYRKQRQRPGWVMGTSMWAVCGLGTAATGPALECRTPRSALNWGAGIKVQQHHVGPSGIAQTQPGPGSVPRDPGGLSSHNLADPVPPLDTDCPKMQSPSGSGMLPLPTETRRPQKHPFSWAVTLWPLLIGQGVGPDWRQANQSPAL